MFFNRRKEQKKSRKSVGAKSSEQVGTAEQPRFPGFAMDKDGNFHLDFDAPVKMHSAPAPSPTLKRLYVISRDNITLEDAQNIVVHAAMKGGHNAILLSETVPLVWCSAYPDELFGSMSLSSLLMGYVEHQEGDRYLKGSSKVMPVEGNFNGYDYYILALVE